MRIDWAADVRRHAPDATDEVIQAIVRHCGVMLRIRETARISFSDQDEMARLRRDLLGRKLGLILTEAEFERAIACVATRMKGRRPNYRVTAYYLLAEHFGALATFVDC